MQSAAAELKDDGPFPVGHWIMLRETIQAIYVMRAVLMLDHKCWVPKVHIHSDSTVKGGFNGATSGELIVMRRFARQQGWIK